MRHQGSVSVLSHIEEIRTIARQDVGEGAVTPSYAADRPAVLRLLNEALATEIVCTLRYRRHYYTADGLLAQAIRSEFLTHAQQEQQHADQIAERIVQLGGQPDFNPESLAGRSHADYHDGTDLREMIQEDLVAERVAIESYRTMIRYLADADPTTRRMLEDILAMEEAHAEELASMLHDVHQVLRSPGRGAPPTGG